MITNFYIDAFNLYFGSCRGTPYKWLDLAKLMGVVFPRNQIGQIKTEEKGSDVNLATHLLHDGYQNRFECAIVVSGDSDLAETVRIVIAELKKPVGSLNPQQKPCRALQATATFYRHIRPSALAKCQFPPTLTDSHGTFSKPSSW